MNVLTLNCLSFGILLNMKTLSIKHRNESSTVFALLTSLYNDVNCYQDSTFASNAQWRRP